LQFSEFTVNGDVLTLQVHSEIRADRFRSICKDMDKAAAASDRLRLLLIMRHYPSFNSAENLYHDMGFLRLYDHAIDRVAVVCDRSWKDTWVGIFSLFSGIRMSFFELPQLDAAARWIQSG
jgi:hypothetical protein